MLFSIITVCFNSAKTIRQTFESVLSQSCKDYEYWVIDGASTDGTVDIIREYEPRFEGRMHWLSEPDKGIYDAMNKGIRLAKGDFLNFLNTDDYYEDNTLGILKKEIENHPDHDVYYGTSRFFDSQGELRIIRENHLRLPKYRVNHQAMWYKRTVFSTFGVYDTSYKISADFHHQIGLFLNSYSFFAFNEVIVNYCKEGYSEKFLAERKKEDRNIRHHYGFISDKEYEMLLAQEKKHENQIKRKIFFHRILLVKYIKKFLKLFCH